MSNRNMWGKPEPKPKRPRGRPRKTTEEKHARKMQTQKHRRQGKKMARDNQEWLDALKPDDAV